MKKIFLVSFFFLITVFSLSLEGISQPVSNRWALLIAIGNYPEPAGVASIKYAMEDADAMQKMFIEHWSVPSQNIMNIRNEQATLENIKKTISELSARVNEQDYLFIYVRAHGEENFPDFNGDEKYGADSCFIPYDCQWKYPKTYITDDKFTVWLRDMRGKIVLIMDFTGGYGIVDFHTIKELEGRTLILSIGGPRLEPYEDELKQHSFMVYKFIEEERDLYEEYLDNIRNDPEEAQNLTLDIILEKVKKEVNSSLEGTGYRGECVIEGKLEPKSIFILKK